MEQRYGLLDKYLSQVEAFGFSGAVLVGQGDQIEFKKAYGFSNIEKNLLSQTDTIYDMGSITKPFTAVAIMKLIQDNKLSLEDRLADILNDKQNWSKEKQDITIHHLLTHTAGIKDTVGDDYLVETTEEVLNRINNQPLLSKPGTEYRYANDGYTLLTMVLEKVTGQEYEEHMHQHIFAPLGMKETGYILPKWNSSKISHGYVNFINYGNSLEKCYPTWALKGNGGMLSTLEDMFRWHKALVNDEILDKKTTELMYTPYLNNYGCGWEVDESNGQLIVSHNGASYYGTSACFYRNLSTKQTVILFTNQSFHHFALIKPLMHHVMEILEQESWDGSSVVKRMNNSPKLTLEALPQTLKGKTIEYRLNGKSAKINWGSHFGLLELNENVLRSMVNKQVNEYINNSLSIAHELVEQNDTTLRLMLNLEIIEQRKTMLLQTIQEYVEKIGEINRISVYGASPSVIMKQTFEIRVELKNAENESSLYMYFFWEEEGKLKFVGFANGLKDIETLLIKPLRLDDWNNKQECVSLSLNSHHFKHFAIQDNELIVL